MPTGTSVRSACNSRIDSRTSKRGPFEVDDRPLRHGPDLRAAHKVPFRLGEREGSTQATHSRTLRSSRRDSLPFQVRSGFCHLRRRLSAFCHFMRLAGKCPVGLFLRSFAKIVGDFLPRLGYLDTPPVRVALTWHKLTARGVLRVSTGPVALADQLLHAGAIGRQVELRHCNGAVAEPVANTEEIVAAGAVEPESPGLPRAVPFRSRAATARARRLFPAVSANSTARDLAPVHFVRQPSPLQRNS